MAVPLLGKSWLVVDGPLDISLSLSLSLSLFFSLSLSSLMAKMEG